MATTGPDRRRGFVFVATGFAALGGLLFGYDTGVISGAILFIRRDFGLGTTRVELVVSAVLWGAIAGAAAGGWLADRFGRRPVILGAALLFVAGAVGTGVAPSLAWLVFGRVVVGVAIGVASLIAPLYIAELAPTALRGSLVAVNQLALVVGILAAYLVDYALAGAAAWRWMLALAAVPASVLAIGMLFLPESPRWLVAHDRLALATDVLARIRREGAPEASAEVEAIRTSLAQQSGSWRELLRPGLRPALIVGMLLALFQQATGINTVIYYAPTIFQFAGVGSSSAAILATVGVGVVNVLATALAVWLLDRVGRRPLLLVSLAGMVVTLAVLGGAFLPALHGSTGWIAVVGLAAYIAFFAVGLGPVFWLLISEIYPLRVRGLAMSAATVVNWGVNLVVALTFLTLTDAIGRAATFWLYAAIGVGAWLFARAAVPETRGHTLEEIEAHWQAGRHPRALG